MRDAVREYLLYISEKRKNKFSLLLSSFLVSLYGFMYICPCYLLFI
jgi:hypothetical protein